MSSSQLRTTDVIIVDSLSDFLGGHFDEVICMRLLEYLRNLSNLGKTMVLVVADGQKGILSLRLASDLHFALPVDEGKGVQVKRYHPPREGSPGVLNFRIDPALGLISQPHRAEKK
jgi:archaellum biogenesis ATPase FlaH